MVAPEEEYSDLRVRKVGILQGKAREAAQRAGANEDDLVILKTSRYHSQPSYEAEKIVGDPTTYLTRPKRPG
ncbi:MAG TPA: hypothetical protein VGG32_07670 [Thermoplasmata archaeon]|jgi:hypothetical protein